MEDLQDKIIELMDLFDGEVTTADKIESPQRALLSINQKLSK